MRSTVLAFLFLVSCAAPASTRTIEPPSSGNEAGASDEGFVLSRARAGGSAAPGDIVVHLDEKWFDVRASFLGVDVSAARARDAAISTSAAPADFWDEQTAVEAVSIWSALCNECHGGRRRVKDATSMAKPPAGWGTGEGLFFGARRPYREIFGVISLGGPIRNGVPSEMPAWQDKLSHEQIWSLIYFLEFQSGGIEGRFPPSLYPRGPASAGE